MIENCTYGSIYSNIDKCYIFLWFSIRYWFSSFTITAFFIEISCNTWFNIYLVDDVLTVLSVTQISFHVLYFKTKILYKKNCTKQQRSEQYRFRSAWITSNGSGLNHRAFSLLLTCIIEIKITKNLWSDICWRRVIR